MDQLRQPRTGATAMTISWPDRHDRPLAAERVASSVPSVQQADQELENLRRALFRAWAEIAELRVLADQDSLTGLANRRRLMTELDLVIADCVRSGASAALVFMDLDRLKRLNDRHGHQAGDAAIVHVARIIHELLPGDFVARLGGDEFALVIRGVDAERARRRAERIAAAITTSPLWCEGVAHRLSVSFGVAAIDPSLSATTLLARADAAMYAGKRAAQAAARSAR